MQEFVFLYRLPADHENSGDDIAAWNAWLAGIGKDLLDVGRPVAAAATIGALDAAPGRLTGYSVIAAEDRQTAEEIAARCPALASGGAVEVAVLAYLPEGHRRVQLMSVAESERGSIRKQIHIAASPSVVYEVISSPEHIARWWSDTADVDPTPGGTGVLVWRERATTKRDHDYRVQLTVVEAVRGERFSFRWVSPDGEAPTEANSVLVTFDVAADGDGTLLTVTEEGMCQLGWEGAVLEEYYRSHEDGWSRHLAELAIYVAELATR